MGTGITIGRQILGDLDSGAAREWLVTDGLGGYAMGTAAGLRTRRYHGLLVAASPSPARRHLGLAALDAVVRLGDRTVRLGTHEWASGAIAPDGYRLLASFTVDDGVPRWRWDLGDVVLVRELAMTHGRNAVGIVHRLERSPMAVEIALEALCTWRDAHGERFGPDAPAVEVVDGGFTFEGAYRVRGPGYEPAGEWYRGVHHRAEAERGLPPNEDLWFAGRFRTVLHAGEAVGVEAWTVPLDSPPPPAAQIVGAARARFGAVARRAGATSPDAALLAHAADQFVIGGRGTPAAPGVVAGYPWFGSWSRDTLTSYEGLFLLTGRAEEGRDLLTTTARSVSEGMLANTADTGSLEYNTVDAALWFLHAVHRHVRATGDTDLAAELVPTLAAIVDHHRAGTRFGIHVDTDGLLGAGSPGVALTWMDARVDEIPITPRAGKPVEINALWVHGVRALADLEALVGVPAASTEVLAARAGASFAARFARRGGPGCPDVVDGPDGDDGRVRPNQLIAGALVPDLVDPGAVVRACAPLVTSLGVRSLSPADPAYRGRHHGGPAERDGAYHQGTVWPWLLGAYVDTCRHAGLPTTGLLDGLVTHLHEWGLGSVSETFDGDPPHAATGCPFQAWSVAELIRAQAAGHGRTHRPGDRG